MHATEYLKAPAEHAVGPIVAVFGPELFLKHEAIREVARQVLGEGEEDAGAVRFPGAKTEFKTVIDALRTVSMWSPRQLVILEDADEFVTENRSALEKYLEKPAKKGVLVLEVRSWTASTKLAKKAASIGLPLDCAALPAAALHAWLSDQAKRKFGKKVDRQAAQRLVELVGAELGQLHQELAKLAAFVGDKPLIESDAVEALVGGWKAETSWAMLDAVSAGDTGTALQLLNKLLVGGEPIPLVLGATSWSFRPLAKAAELARLGTPLGDALAEAGVKPFRIRASESYLRRVGYPRASQISRWLLQADLDVKGSSSLPERVILERLLVLLSAR